MLFYFLLFIFYFNRKQIFFLIYSDHGFPPHTLPKFLPISPSIQILHFCLFLHQNWTKRPNSVRVQEKAQEIETPLHI